MRAAFLVIIAVAAGFCAYVFWPRTPSLTAFDPASRTRCEVGILRQAQGFDRGILPAYELLAGEFNIPPLDAVAASWHLTEAIRIHRRAVDAPEEEKAREPLEEFYKILERSLSLSAGPEALARAELNVWRLEANAASREKTVAARAELLALLHGKKPANWIPVARELTLAREAAAAGRWEDATSRFTAAWHAARRLLDTPARN